MDKYWESVSEEDMAEKESLFARELNRVLDRSNFAPEDVVRQLQSAGFFVFPGTLYEWCRGQSLPRAALSFQVAASLEDILGIPRGQLCERLLHDLFPFSVFAPDECTVPEIVTFPSESDSDVSDFDDFDTSSGDTDWTIDAHRLVVKDEVRVSADYKTVVWNTTIGSLVPPVPQPSVEVGVKLRQGEVPYQGKFIFNVQGAYIGKESCVEDGGERVYTAHLILSSPDITPGDLSFCSYTRGSTAQVEQTRLAWRFFRKSLDYYSATVFFEGEAPQSAEYVIESRYGNGETEPSVVEPLEIRDNYIKIAVSDFGQEGQSGYIRCS